MDESNVDSRVMLMSIPSTGNRSISPMSPTPSPSRELRGVRLFRAISRKLGRRSAEDLSYTGEDDSRSSSTDSCSSTSASGRCSRSKKVQNEGSSCSSGGSGFRSASPNHISSSSSSESGSESQQTTKRHRHHHSTTGASFRKVFQTPKRILRPPVTYTYVRGLSGLPTQRIARTPPRTYTSQNGCGCSGPYFPGLNR
ncbi:uncharacterized protein CBL_11874 [Carabus blaptoides fortunei]